MRHHHEDVHIEKAQVGRKIIHSSGAVYLELTLNEAFQLSQKQPRWNRTEGQNFADWPMCGPAEQKAV